MKYNLDWLLEEYDKGTPMKYLFFWGHTPKTKTSIDKSCFSQWFPSVFQIDDNSYPTAEHWMMAKKALLFEDNKIFAEILESDSPALAKKLGRKVQNFIPEVWDAHKYEIVVEGNLHKFGQNAALQAFLLTTGNRILVEASPYDKIWGIGKTANAKMIENPHTWNGENLLGFALMEVRDKLNFNNDDV